MFYYGGLDLYAIYRMVWYEFYRFVSFLHPVTGLFPYANAGELFVYLGIANGVTEAGYSLGALATRYFLAGIVIILVRGLVTEWITKFLAKRQGISVEATQNLESA